MRTSTSGSPSRRRTSASTRPCSSAFNPAAPIAWWCATTPHPKTSRTSSIEAAGGEQRAAGRNPRSSAPPPPPPPPPPPRPAAFVIATRDELWLRGRLVESRLSHGEAIEDERGIVASDARDDALVAICGGQ